MAFRHPWRAAALASTFTLAGAVLGCGESPPPPPPTTSAPASAAEPEAHHKARRKRDTRTVEEKDMGIAEKREQRRKEAEAAGAPAE